MTEFCFLNDDSDAWHQYEQEVERELELLRQSTAELDAQQKKMDEAFLDYIRRPFGKKLAAASHAVMEATLELSEQEQEIERLREENANLRNEVNAVEWMNGLLEKELAECRRKT